MIKIIREPFKDSLSLVLKNKIILSIMWVIFALYLLWVELIGTGLFLNSRFMYLNSLGSSNGLVVSSYDEANNIVTVNFDGKDVNLDISDCNKIEISPGSVSYISGNTFLHPIELKNYIRYIIEFIILSYTLGVIVLFLSKNLKKKISKAIMLTIYIFSTVSELVVGMEWSDGLYNYGNIRPICSGIVIFLCIFKIWFLVQYRSNQDIYKEE